MDMTRSDYQKSSAEQKERGLFPLFLQSYGDENDVRSAALWVRGRIQE
jgi:hypothetical protein